MTTNIDDFMGEHLADKAAAEAEERRVAAEKEEADRKVRQEQDAKARLMINRSRYAIRKAIADAAIALGSTASTPEDTHELFIDGIDASYWLAFVEERTHTSSWRSHNNGKMRLTVGDFGDRVSFPQKKDGTHNYVEVASKLRARVARRIADDHAKLNQQRNSNAAAAISKEFNLPEYHQLVVPSSYTVGKVVIDFSKINKATMSPEHARKVLQALRDLDVKLSYNDK